MNNTKPYAFDTVVDRRQTGSLKWEKFGDPAVLPMWVADMDFPIAPEIINELKQRLDHPVLGYTQPTNAVVASVVDYLADHHGWKIDPDWLAWVPGVLPAVAAFSNLLDPQDEILVFTPVYHPLLLIPEKSDRIRVDVPLQYTDNRWTIDFNAFEKAITKHSKLLLLSSPHNPVGSIFSRDELRRVTEICSDHNILVLSDEIHCDLILHKDKKHIPTGLAAAELGAQVITLMSPSKTFNLAGANCSFAVIPDASLRQQFVNHCIFTVPLVPTLSYTATQAAYTHGWPWHQKLIDYLRGNLELLKREVGDIPYLWMDDTEATYLAWINTRDLPVDNAYDFMLNAGIGLSPGTQFGDGDYQRLNFACSRAQLRIAIERIKKAVGSIT